MKQQGGIRSSVLGIAVAVAAGGLFLGATEAAAFRCGSGVVSIGDNKSRVMIECGKPTYRERVGTQDRRSGEPGARGKRSRRGVEQWTYNCGEHDFIYILTFEGGKLVKEETNGRGKGKSRCGGN